MPALKGYEGVRYQITCKVFNGTYGQVYLAKGLRVDRETSQFLVDEQSPDQAIKFVNQKRTMKSGYERFRSPSEIDKVEEDFEEEYKTYKELRYQMTANLLGIDNADKDTKYSDENES